MTFINVKLGRGMISLAVWLSGIMFLRGTPEGKESGFLLVLKSSAGHSSGWYASYWNAFLFKFITVSFVYLRSPLDRILSFLDWKHYKTKSQRLRLDRL